MLPTCPPRHAHAQVRDPQSKTPSLIFEYVNNTDFKVGGDLSASV